MKGPWRTSLLVSVRSAEEARAAVEGGASVIDVKEPDRGPLGRASAETWRSVREAVPREIPVSVALGELRDWNESDPRQEFDSEGFAFLKLGLAGAGPDWVDRWAAVRRAWRGEARWVAVAYADWRTADAPRPSEVLGAAIEARDCRGILLDTFDKAKPISIDPTSEWVDWVDNARKTGLLVALAGGLDLAAILRLAPLGPDLFAVRGAACDRSERTGTVRAHRVAELVRTIRSVASGETNPDLCNLAPIISSSRSPTAWAS